jgi:hypothetical protein
MGGELVQDFSKEDYEIYRVITRRVFSDISSFHDIWNPAIESMLGISPFDPNRSNYLGVYVKSLNSTFEQGLYALSCLEGYSKSEPSNITVFFVSHYFIDFMIRVKTGTDLIALIIRNIYDLNIEDKQCSLENGALVSRLRYLDRSNDTVDRLSREIDRIRTKWLNGFDILRDIAIHQAGFEYTIVGGSDFPVHLSLPLPTEFLRNQPISYNPMDPLETLEPFIKDEPLAKFLAQIKSKSISNYLISINPVSFCNEVWQLWSNSSQSILELCCKDLVAKLRTSN